MKLKKKLIDPPSGWKYGFPKEYDENKDGNLKDFLKKNGYPEKDLDFAIQHCRMLYIEDENEN